MSRYCSGVLLSLLVVFVSGLGVWDFDDTEDFFEEVDRDYDTIEYYYDAYDWFTTAVLIYNYIDDGLVLAADSTKYSEGLQRMLGKTAPELEILRLKREQKYAQLGVSKTDVQRARLKQLREETRLGLFGTVDLDEIDDFANATDSLLQQWMVNLFGDPFEYLVQTWLNNANLALGDAAISFTVGWEISIAGFSFGEEGGIVVNSDGWLVVDVDFMGIDFDILGIGGMVQISVFGSCDDVAGAAEEFSLTYSLGIVEFSLTEISGMFGGDIIGYALSAGISFSKDLGVGPLSISDLASSTDVWSADLSTSYTSACAASSSSYYSTFSSASFFGEYMNTPIVYLICGFLFAFVFQWLYNWILPHIRARSNKLTASTEFQPLI